MANQRNEKPGLLGKRSNRWCKDENWKKQCEVVQFHHSSTWTSAGAWRHFALERIVLSLACFEIAGSVPTRISLQILESEVRAFKNAEECPYPVDGFCPHAGTGRSAECSTDSENDTRR